MVRYRIYLLIVLLLSGANVFSQVSLSVDFIDYDTKLHINSIISLQRTDIKSDKIIIRNVSSYTFNSIPKGIYKIEVIPSPDSVSKDTIWENMNDIYDGKLIAIPISRYYCTIIKDNFKLSKNEKIIFNLLYSHGGIWHGDGFPKITKSINDTIPYISTSSIVIGTSGGNISRYSVIDTVQSSVSRFVRDSILHVQNSTITFQDIYLKTENNDTIHYHCKAGTIYWIDYW